VKAKGSDARKFLIVLEAADVHYKLKMYASAFFSLFVETFSISSAYRFLAALIMPLF
jgi:hypothetical protein